MKEAQWMACLIFSLAAMVPVFADNPVTTTTLSEQRIVKISAVVDEEDIDDELDALVDQLYEYLDEEEIEYFGEPYTRVEEDESNPGMYLIETGISVMDYPQQTGDFRNDSLPAGSVATTIYMGSDNDIYNGYASINRWMSLNGYFPIGRPWHIPLAGGGFRIYWPYSRIAP